ncbi:PREDICTED: uncharacterized protein LOC105111022 [Populus euphratica]|uniref:Uncharacterized protein LOC105111022 n=1 Tax=Populus euphratica TaxID=75702 RepID=A0AAJ6T5F9_POPEU|nr:PREDICTED: uncharacterized protein LOC105111022 [Populus euphratica]
MASTDKQQIGDRDAEEKDEDKGGFIGKVKDFINDIGEKNGEGAIGFGKPTADVPAIYGPSINLDKADTVVDVLIKNPAPLIDIDYLIESDSRKLDKKGKIY